MTEPIFRFDAVSVDTRLRGVRMAVVETVRGAVPQDALGTVLMHEHVFVLNEEIRQNCPELWDEEERVADAVVRPRALKELGVDTIVDPTVLGLGRDIRRVARVNEQVELNIVVATGLYTYNDVPFFFHFHGPGTLLGGDDVMVDMFVGDITTGIAGTGIKAAFLKCAIEDALTPGVERVLRAVAEAHKRTGVPIMVHTSPSHCTGLVAQRVLSEEGVDLGKVLIAHSGDTTDLDYLHKLIDAGSYLGMDIAPSLVTALKEAFSRANVFNGYGMTETASLITVLPDHDAVEHADSVGYAVPVVDLAIDPIGNNPNLGELLARGPNLMAGYWKRPDATADAYSHGWLRTGDVVLFDQAGRISIVDRIKDIIIRGGENVSSEVENALAAGPGVAEAAVLGVPDDIMGEKIGAVVVGIDGGDLDVAALIKHCRDLLADFKVPQCVAVVPGPLPRNAGGKILTAQLRHEVDSGRAPSMTVWQTKAADRRRDGTARRKSRPPDSSARSDRGSHGLV